MRSSTALSAGSWNGVKVPLRASDFPGDRKREDGEDARKAPQQTVERTVRPSPAGHPAPHSVSLGLVAPCQRPFRYQQIKPIGGESEKCHGQHDRIHRVVDAVGAERADQIAEALLRHDQFG